MFILASTIAPMILKVFMFPFFGPVSFPVDIENDMKAQGIPYEIVEEVPEKYDVGSGLQGYYDLDEDMIYFVSEDGYFSSGEFLAEAVHEMIHYYRNHSGAWSGDLFLEETIAVYGAPMLDKDMGMGSISMSDKDLDRWFLRTQNGNLGEVKLPSKEQKEKAMIEIESLRKYLKKTLDV